MKPVQKFSSKKPLSKEDLKLFRSYVSQLKKQGLIPGKTNPRVARPAFVRGGKTLAEIVNANRDKLSAPTPPLARVRSPISVRDLPMSHRHKSLAGLFKDLEKNHAAIDKLKKPDEFFAFQIHGTDSLQPFRNIQRIIDYLLDSDQIQLAFHKRNAGQEIFDGLKIVRWNKDRESWKQQRRIRKPKKSHAAAQAKSRAKKRKIT